MTRVKICGLRCDADIAYVNACLPDYIGFVFAESRRQVDAATAKRLRRLLHPHIASVGVFVNQSLQWIAGLVREGVIDLVQLHGEESLEEICALQAMVSVPIIKSVQVVDRIPDLPHAPEYLLFDKASAQRGGTGQVFDWRLLDRYCGGPYFLAGGLTCENVADAVQRLHPWCVDVSSGVETDGIKDRDKIARFIQTVHEQMQQKG